MSMRSPKKSPTRKEKGRRIWSETALTVLRSRLCNPSSAFRFLSDFPDTNYSKLKFIISSSVTGSANNSVLLLGPRGSGKLEVLDLVLGDLLQQFPDVVSMVRLNGLLHGDDNCAVKEIARQLCMEHHLVFSKAASFDDNSQFMMALLRECGLAHKTVIFVLDEFDLFTQGKQRFLYSLLDAMQTVESQAVVVGISCRLDADQLLEKRVRSRFSHRKLLFLPPSLEDIERLVEHMLCLPEDLSLPQNYIVEYNQKLKHLLADKRLKEIICTYIDFGSSVSQLMMFLFQAVSNMSLELGVLSLDNFKMSLSRSQQQPKVECIKGCSILELYLLVCMKRLEVKEQNTYNFNSVMTAYDTIHNSSMTPDKYARHVCLRAFEHLLQRELICFTDNRGQNQPLEHRTVKLLVSPIKLYEVLKSLNSCPVILIKLMDSP